MATSVIHRYNILILPRASQPIVLPTICIQAIKYRCIHFDYFSRTLIGTRFKTVLRLSAFYLTSQNRELPIFWPRSPGRCIYPKLLYFPFVALVKLPPIHLTLLTDVKSVFVRFQPVRAVYYSFTCLLFASVIL